MLSDENSPRTRREKFLNGFQGHESETGLSKNEKAGRKANHALFTKNVIFHIFHHIFHSNQLILMQFVLFQPQVLKNTQNPP